MTKGKTLIFLLLFILIGAVGFFLPETISGFYDKQLEYNGGSFPMEPVQLKSAEQLSLPARLNAVSRGVSVDATEDIALEDFVNTPGIRISDELLSMLIQLYDSFGLYLPVEKLTVDDLVPRYYFEMEDTNPRSSFLVWEIVLMDGYGNQIILTLDSQSGKILLLNINQIYDAAPAIVSPEFLTALQDMYADYMGLTVLPTESTLESTSDGSILYRYFTLTDGTDTVRICCSAGTFSLTIFPVYMGE